MTISLYDATVPSFLRTLNASKDIFNLGLEYCKEKNINTDDFVECQIIGDMLPLRFQAQSISLHSAGALIGIAEGTFSPPSEIDLPDYASLQKHIDDAITAVKKVSPEDVNALQGKEVVFSYGDYNMPFTVEDFLFSFSLPNFYFHATTAYDLLRMKGVPLSKMHFMGKLPIKKG